MHLSMTYYVNYVLKYMNRDIQNFHQKRIQISWDLISGYCYKKAQKISGLSKIVRSSQTDTVF